MTRKILVSIFSFLFLATSAPGSSASTANPPVIESVTQLTQGPYKPGDTISFKVVVTGGEPGIKNIVFSAGCIKGIGPSGNILLWDEKTIETPGFVSQEIFTSIVSGECENGTKTASVAVTDKTGITTSLNAAASYIVQNAYLLPNGTVRPEKLADYIDLKYIPTPLYDPKLKQSWDLPKFTKSGVPLFWEVNSNTSKGCTLTKRFPTDIGGKLTLVGRGLCILNRPYVNDSTNHFYGYPIVTTNWKIGSPTSRFIRGDVWVKGKPQYVLCVKGSKSFKYKSPDATCLKGYTEK
jgi:hypothetical protein